VVPGADIHVDPIDGSGEIGGRRQRRRPAGLVGRRRPDVSLTTDMATEVIHFRAWERDRSLHLATLTVTVLPTRKVPKRRRVVSVRIVGTVTGADGLHRAFTLTLSIERDFACGAALMCGMRKGIVAFCIRRCARPAGNGARGRQRPDRGVDRW